MSDEPTERDVCSIPECDRPQRVKSRALCNGHYQRWAKWGDPLSHGVGRPDDNPYRAAALRGDA